MRFASSSRWLCIHNWRYERSYSHTAPAAPAGNRSRSRIATKNDNSIDGKREEQLVSFRLHSKAQEEIAIMTMIETHPRVRITDQQRQQYRDEGYFILERALSDEHLELLRSEAQHAIDMVDRRMDEAKTDVIGICHRGKRYFSHNVFKDRPVLRQ